MIFLVFIIGALILGSLYFVQSKNLLDPNLVIVVLTFLYLLATVAIWSVTRSTSRRQSTIEIWDEWFSSKSTALWRAYVFNIFVPDTRYWCTLVDDKTVSMRNLSSRLPPEWGDYPQQLVWWFDRLGCLGAEGLIEIDFILMPMQHLVKRTWWVMEPFILRAREMDPIYCTGFAWLYEECERRSQNDRIKAMFKFKKLPGHIRGKDFREQTEMLESRFRSFLVRTKLRPDPRYQESVPITDWDPSYTHSED